mmetsp:Transcript_22472/g.60774  ORF Transcript_22472/g.60774 Transcript_22472/m.60774 type:complete len:340 (-) Transcript_22472:648-1667(-)
MQTIKGAVSAVVPQSVKSYALSTAEYFAPVMTESQFQESGMLTPEEFVTAGDMLVLKCPTWQWSAGDQSKVRPHLPVDKQFLITRNVPCLQRAKALMAATDEMLHAGAGEGEMDEDGWTTTGTATARTGDADEALPDLGSMESPPEPATARAGAASDLATARTDAGETAADGRANEDDDLPNMEDFEEENLEDEHDPAALGVGALSIGDAGADGDGNIIRTRTYDLSITYDKYYRCPRVWLYGYTEARQPLTNEQVLEDVSAEHANKTCTMEPHPHLDHGVFASIHPCRHAETMKRLCAQLESGGAHCRTDQYLFLFLKFISTVIPTIDYDFTTSFEGF